MSFFQDNYQKTLSFAARVHGTQCVPGTTLPYVVHLSNVTMEVIVASAHDQFNAELAVTCALLHDVIEDTQTSTAELEATFGTVVARGVEALTKDEKLPKEGQMADSLKRILEQPREVAIVKLADRITNLQQPPEYWSAAKRLRYQEEARFILNQLGHACQFLSDRLAIKIEEYSQYINGF